MHGRSQVINTEHYRATPRMKAVASALRRAGCSVTLLACSGHACAGAGIPVLHWQALPALPGPPGVAGAFGGMDNGSLIVAGGSNFQPGPDEDLWSAPKLWHKECYVLRDPASAAPQWSRAGTLSEARGNGASASSPQGLVCLGGDDGVSLTRRAFLLRWVEGALQEQGLPDLPVAASCGSAAVIGRTVYYLTGQIGSGLETADPRFWSLELPADGRPHNGAEWTALPPLPGGGRAFAALVAQNNGREICLYAIGGRRASSGEGTTAKIEPLREVHAYSPSENRWRRCSDAPVAIMAAPVIPFGSSQILVLGGDDGALMARTAELKSAHPGFPRRAYVYDTISDRWDDAGQTPANQVAAVTGAAGEQIFVATGEVKPRHRTTSAWRVTASPAAPHD